jgi:transitional endoplasmic reticulum ATPase
MKKNTKLRVAEAKPTEVGRGIVRLDSEAIESLRLITGDVVKITGTKTTVAKVWPGYPQDTGTGKIRMDGIVRRNAGVGLDDNVEVEKINVVDAKKITFAPTQPVKIMGGEEYLNHLLEGHVFTKGDSLAINIMGRQLDLVVASFSPHKEAVILTSATNVLVSAKPVPEKDVKLPRVSYEDIGGLEDEVKKVREMIELPLRHPEIFDKLGVEAPKGILLHGPPGTGKTLLARAVASETNANFQTLSGPEIMSKYYGQSEENLREIFNNAEENAPSIILIDEIDSIAPKRDEVR